jgi:dTDP-4-amino-4,6-dideoxygalactose transaminase
MGAWADGRGLVKRIELMRPLFGEEEVAAVAHVLHSGWVAQGPRVAEFERRFADRQQVGHAVATSSWASALHLAVVVAGVTAGDDVTMPSYSRVATAETSACVGARPVFADVDPSTGNVTAVTVEAAITPRTAAVIAIDQGGVPVDLDPIRRLCQPLAISVIEDAASAAGAWYRDRPVGCAADVAVWSFHSDEILTTGEGGMLTTNNAAWALRARQLRDGSVTSSATGRRARGATAVARDEDFQEPGLDCRMTDLQAAVGVVQLGRLDEVVRRRRELAARYSAAIAGVAGLRPVADPSHGSTNYQSYWVEVLADYPLDRDGLLAALEGAGVAAQPGCIAVHGEPTYGARTRAANSLPATDRLARGVVVLPLFDQMSVSDQTRVIEVLRSAGDVLQRSQGSASTAPSTMHP